MKFIASPNEMHTLKSILETFEKTSSVKSKEDPFQHNPLITVKHEQDGACVVTIDEDYVVDSMLSTAPHLHVIIPLVESLYNAVQHYVSVLAEVAKKHAKRILEQDRKPKAKRATVKIIECPINVGMREGAMHIAYLCRTLGAANFASLPVSMQECYINVYGNDIADAVNNYLINVPN